MSAKCCGGCRYWSTPLARDKDLSFCSRFDMLTAGCMSCPTFERRRPSARSTLGSGLPPSVAERVAWAVIDGRSPAHADVALLLFEAEGIGLNEATWNALSDAAGISWPVEE